MWFFNSPEVVYGDGALSYLDEIRGWRAFLVADRTMGELGFIERVKQELERADRLISSRLQACNWVRLQVSAPRRK